MCNQDTGVTVNMRSCGFAAGLALQKTSHRMFEIQTVIATGETEVRHHCHSLSCLHWREPWSLWDTVSVGHCFFPSSVWPVQRLEGHRAGDLPCVTRAPSLGGVLEKLGIREQRMDMRKTT
jgi:hypothetical protein